MKKIFFACMLMILAVGCRQKASRTADVSGINLDIKIARFDRDFWALRDSKDLGADLDRLFAKYPRFAPVYFGGVVYFGNSRDTILRVLPKFFADSVAKQFYTDALKRYEKVSDIEKQLTNAFKRGKYFFPQLSVPQIIMCVSLLNQNMIVADSLMGRSEGTMLMACCCSGLKALPGSGATGSTLLCSSALKSWRSVASVPSRSCSLLAFSTASAASRLSSTGQQACSKAFNGELAAFGNFFFGPAAGVLRLGLRAQGLVSQLGVFGLQGRQLGLQVFQLRQRISLIGRLRGFQLFRQHFARQAVFRVLIHGSFRK